LKQSKFVELTQKGIGQRTDEVKGAELLMT